MVRAYLPDANVHSWLDSVISANCSNQPIPITRQDKHKYRRSARERDAGGICRLLMYDIFAAALHFSFSIAENATPTHSKKQKTKLAYRRSVGNEALKDLFCRGNNGYQSSCPTDIWHLIASFLQTIAPIQYEYPPRRRQNNERLKGQLSSRPCISISDMWRGGCCTRLIFSH